MKLSICHKESLLTLFKAGLFGLLLYDSVYMSSRVTIDIISGGSLWTVAVRCCLHVIKSHF